MSSFKAAGLVIAIGAATACTSQRAFNSKDAARDQQADTGNAVGSNWFLAGSAPEDYQAQAAVGSDGTVSGSLASSSATDDVFGTEMTYVDVSPFAGQTVRLRAQVTTTGVTDWAGLWMRVDGDDEQVLAFDNMSERPITGTTTSAEYDVVLDVAADATGIGYGVLLVGNGEVDIQQLTFEVIPPTTPDGWFLAGSDPEDFTSTASVGSDGTVSGTLASTATPPDGGFGTLMNQVDATAWRGQNVVLAAEVKATNVTGAGAGLWVRVDTGDTADAFDNMQDRPILGTLDWTPYQVELPVAADATDVAFGILEQGTGALQFRNLTITAAP